MLNKPFAVVELFTSEGCSSCPPADALLNKIIGEHADDQEARVIALAYHVDYWDRLGWKDPFSAPEFTQRQQAYATQAGEEGVYTPEMIVNGHDGFVGSHEADAREAIRKALAKPVDITLTANACRSADSRGITVQWKSAAVREGAMGELKGAVIEAVLVQPSAVTNVRRGENAGRELHHGNIVRALEAEPLGDRTEGQILLRNDGADGAFVVLLVRDSGGVIRATSGEIAVGATGEEARK